MVDFLAELKLQEDAATSAAKKVCRDAIVLLANGGTPDAGLLRDAMKVAELTVDDIKSETERISSRVELLKRREESISAEANIPVVTEKLNAARAILKAAEDAYEEAANPLRYKLSRLQSTYLSRGEIDANLRKSIGSDTRDSVQVATEKWRGLEADRLALKEAVYDKQLTITNNDAVADKERDWTPQKRESFVDAYHALKADLEAKIIESDAQRKLVTDLELGSLVAESF